MKDALDVSDRIFEFEKFMTNDLRVRNPKLHNSIANLLEAVYRKDQDRLATCVTINPKLVEQYNKNK